MLFSEGIGYAGCIVNKKKRKSFDSRFFAFFEKVDKL